jgi:hypothetical protein
MLGSKILIEGKEYILAKEEKAPDWITSPTWYDNLVRILHITTSNYYTSITKRPFSESKACSFLLDSSRYSEPFRFWTFLFWRILRIWVITIAYPTRQRITTITVVSAKKGAIKTWISTTCESNSPLDVEQNKRTEGKPIF